MSNMTSRIQRSLLAFLAGFIMVGSLAVLAGGGTARGQSASKSQPGASDGAKTRDIALEGYCPVCIIELKKWVRGKPEYQVKYDGRTYFFPGQKQKEMFLVDPAKYVPAFGGDCTVCYAKLGKRVPGNIRHAALHEERLFLFPGDEQKQAFLADPEKYADVDLALDGICAVCRIELNKDVPGKPEIAAYHKGLRYLFPSDEQRKMFLANPEKYAVQPRPNQQSTNRTDKAQLVSIQGKSSCAGCEHGVAPVGSPDELGLAIVGDDGRVYVIEEAHKLYPDVYENRFDGLTLQASGTVVKRDGTTTWIQPTRLTVAN